MPRRDAKPPSVTKTDEDSEVVPVPSWDSSGLTLMIWLLALTRYLPKELDGVKSFIRHGYITAKHKMVLRDKAHWDDLHTGTSADGTYRDPYQCPVTAPPRASSPTGSHASGSDIAIAARPAHPPVDTDGFWDRGNCI